MQVYSILNFVIIIKTEVGKTMKNTGTDQNVFKRAVESFFDRAQRVIPGGVNSPVRA